jgi:hypothetical protein
MKHTNTLNNDSEPIKPINDTNKSNTITIKTFIPSMLYMILNLGGGECGYIGIWIY